MTDVFADMWLNPDSALDQFKDGEMVEVCMIDGELTNLYVGELEDEEGEAPIIRGYYNEDGEGIDTRRIYGVKPMQQSALSSSRDDSHA